MERGDTIVGHPASIDSIFEPDTPKPVPIIPQIKDNVSASIMNWSLMSQVFAPTAILIPISLVLSVTETSMIFIIPIPPTIRETEAMDPSNNAITREDCSAACII